MKKDTTMDSKINLSLTRDEAILLCASLLPFASSKKLDECKGEESRVLFSRIVNSIKEFDNTFIS